MSDIGVSRCQMSEPQEAEWADLAVSVMTLDSS